jgi:hypothetical protein
MENHFLITCGYPHNCIKSITCITKKKTMMGKWSHLWRGHEDKSTRAMDSF